MAGTRSASITANGGVVIRHARAAIAAAPHRLSLDLTIERGDSDRDDPEAASFPMKLVGPGLAPAAAQYPARPISLIVAFTPGGPSDVAFADGSLSPAEWAGAVAEADLVLTGAASIYRLMDENGDGDALDDGEMTVVADGLTTVTDIAVDRDDWRRVVVLLSVARSNPQPIGRQR